MKKTESLQIKMAQAKGATQSRGASTRNFLLTIFFLLATFSVAQLPVPASSEFDITGFIEVATLGGVGSGPGVGAHQGGFITVNGHLITVPSETIVILPANALTWQELFAQAPAPYTGVATGLASADVPAPLTTYEAHVIGNRVLGGPGGSDVYIAGLIYVSQQALNQGQGFINCINYTNGEVRVGGTIGNCLSGTRVHLNTPLIPALGTGRYGRPMSPDPRFTSDPDNPTILSITGFPMCIPRVTADPNIAGNPDDALCPHTQRPLANGTFSSNFTTTNPLTQPGVPPVPTLQAPFEVGDYVTFAGTLVQDLRPLNPTAGPWPGIANTYISAHTMVNNVAIYTSPGTNPAYVTVNVSLMGTGGLTVLGVGETAVRTRFEGFTTDVAVNPASQRLINVYGIDLNSATGAPSDRFWGTIGVDPGPPNGAAKGLWRFRPPCLAFGAIPTKPDKECVTNMANSFLPPTRELRAVLGATQSGSIPAAFTAPITPTSPTSANGLVYGQYHLPIASYIFPEQLPGQPIPENNFNTMPFLANGGYTSAAGTLVKQLNPWPSNGVPPLPACSATPIANPGDPYTVPSGGSITLSGTATAPDPVTAFSWTVTLGTLSNPAIANPVYKAPTVGPRTTATATFTVTTCAGSSSASTTITINAATAPTVSDITPLSLFSGQATTMPVTGSDPNVPALLPLLFASTQSGAPALNPFTITQGPNPPGTGATIHLTAPTLPLTQITPTTITLSTTAKNTGGIVSAPDITTVTVNPLPDSISVASAEYRTGLLRLIITVNDSNPNVTLKLQPYLTTAGTTFDPATIGNTFTNNLNGTFTLDITGVPAPVCNPGGAYATPCPSAPLDVKSNITNVPGDSGPFALTRIRP